MLYSTPAKYRAHLERILWYLDAFPNYQTVFSDDPTLKNVIAYAKWDRRALLVKTATPFAVFDVIEQSMAAAVCYYLHRVAAEKLGRDARHAVTERISEEIRRLDKAK